MAPASRKSDACGKPEPLPSLAWSPPDTPEGIRRVSEGYPKGIEKEAEAIAAVGKLMNRSLCCLLCRKGAHAMAEQAFD
jgi:hypothetical protein